MLTLMLALSYSHYLLSSQKNFPCQSLQILARFITRLNFVFLLFFRYSYLPAQISESHFTWAEILQFLQNLSFSGPHDSHKH